MYCIKLAFTYLLYRNSLPYPTIFSFMFKLQMLNNAKLKIFWVQCNLGRNNITNAINKLKFTLVHVHCIVLLVQLLKSVKSVNTCRCMKNAFL